MVISIFLMFGPVAYYLGLLATLLGRRQQAAEHFEEALAMCEQLEAWPWLAHAQHAYARLLLSGDAAGEQEKAFHLLNWSLAAARELGMTRLEERAATLRAEAMI